MKDYEISRESMMISAEEQNIPFFFSNNESSLDFQYSEANVRDSLTNSLGNLCNSVRTLLLVLEENNIVNILPEVAVPQYFEVLDRITQDAINSIESVHKSQEFEGMKFLNKFPQFECNILQ